ncbi:DUF2029 domain-containing protein, partial [bacterium]|nr:DUF2029 domain-containing protein [bacterium]
RWKLLIVSLTLQLVLGVLFGHAYDMKISMATGYLVAHGQNPYIARDLSQFFHNSAFQNLTSSGYPPPWALVLGAVYLVSYGLIPNLLLYNLASKLPIIAANVYLAFLTADFLSKRGVPEKTIRWAWAALLFNPLLLITTTAWGQFDSIVALLILLSLVNLGTGRQGSAAVLLALAIAFKPITLPILLASSLYLLQSPIRTRLRYFLVFGCSLLALCVVPFIIFQWNPTIILQHWNAHFTVGGGMSFMTYLELMRNSYAIPGRWWLPGFAWVPALLGAAVLFRNRAANLVNLIKTSLALTMVFFLTRAWVAEPNIVILLPLILILVALDEFRRWTWTVIWVIPLVFAVLNTSLFQLLFPVFPGLLQQALTFSSLNKPLLLQARIDVTIVWLLAGMLIVVYCFQSAARSKAVV